MQLSQERINGIIANPTEREDVAGMSVALDLGFTPHQDKDAELPWPIKAESSIYFVKGEKHIWFAPRALHGVDPDYQNRYVDPWKCADLVDGSFTAHRAYDSLVEALNAEGASNE